MTASSTEATSHARPETERASTAGGVRHSLGVYALSRVVVLVVAGATRIMVLRSGTLLGLLTRWDGGWYLAVARNGYPPSVPTGSGPPAQSNIAFFPGYPLAIRAVSTATRLSPSLSAILISTLAGAGLAVTIWMLARRLADDRTADRAVTLFCFFPSAFVLSLAYSDALFLLLTALCLLALLEERWLWAGIAAALAGAVRPTGMILIPVCAWAALVCVKRRHDWRALVAPALAPLGTLAFFVFLFERTGDPLAFFHAEDRGWLTDVNLGVAYAQEAYHAILFHRFRILTLAVLLLGVGALVAAYLLIRWRPPGFLSVYVSGVIILMVATSNPTSVPRFFLAAFPLAIPSVKDLSDRSYAGVVASSAALMAMLFMVIAVAKPLAP